MKKNLNLIAPINYFGYGVVGTHVTVELAKHYNVSLFPIGGKAECDAQHHEIIKECSDNARFFDWDADCIRLFHQHSMAEFVGRGKHIGWPIFELDRFNDLELHHLGNCDEWIVCSEWAKEILVNSLYRKYKWPDIERRTHVVPLGVDIEEFKPQQSYMENTIFLNVGKWETRKGHDIIPAIFDEAFTEEDNVELWMLCENPFCNEQETKNWHSKYHNMKLASKVRILDRQSSRKGVYDIMSQAHCGIFPARAEGWNLDMLEMMAIGKHIITTDYSAHKEFCNKHNSLLVEPTSKQSAYDGKWFFNQGSWANLDDKIGEFANHMKTVHKTVQKGEVVNESGIATGRKFTWGSGVQRITSIY